MSSWRQECNELWENEVPPEIPKHVKDSVFEHIDREYSSESGPDPTVSRMAGTVSAFSFANGYVLTPYDLDAELENYELKEAASAFRTSFGQYGASSPGFSITNPRMYAPGIIEGHENPENYFFELTGLPRTRREKDLLWKKTLSILNDASRVHFYREKHGNTRAWNVASGAVYSSGEAVSSFLDTDEITLEEVSEAADTTVSTVSRYANELEERNLTGIPVKELDKLSWDF